MPEAVDSRIHFSLGGHGTYDDRRIPFVEAQIKEVFSSDPNVLNAYYKEVAGGTVQSLRVMRRLIAAGASYPEAFVRELCLRTEKKEPSHEELAHNLRMFAITTTNPSYFSFHEFLMLQRVREYSTPDDKHLTFEFDAEAMYPQEEQQIERYHQKAQDGWTQAQTYLYTRRPLYQALDIYWTGEKSMVLAIRMRNYHIVNDLSQRVENATRDKKPLREVVRIGESHGDDLIDGLKRRHFRSKPEITHQIDPEDRRILKPGEKLFKECMKNPAYRPTREELLAAFFADITEHEPLINYQPDIDGLTVIGQVMENISIAEIEQILRTGHQPTIKRLIKERVQAVLN